MGVELPYRCPDCGSRRPPSYSTWGVEEPASRDCEAVGVSCSDCTTLWGVAVTPAAEDARRLDPGVATPGDDLAAVMEGLRYDDESVAAYDLDHRGHRCPHCEESVVPTTGLVVPDGEDYVWRVSAQYCPECEGVLDVTWG